MLTHRCPWCGEKIPAKVFKPSDPISIAADEGSMDTCPSCKKPHKSQSSSIILISIAAIFLIMKFIFAVIRSSSNTFVFMLSLILLIIGIASICFAFIGYFRFPYIRDHATEGRRKGRSCLTAIAVVIVDFVVIVGIDFKDHFIIYWLAFLLIIMGVAAFSYFKYRHNCKKEKQENAKPFANVNIVWDSHKHGGLIAPRLRILKGEIFPVCFMNAEKTTISGALCVVLDDLKWSGTHRCTCNIQLVLDTLSEKNFFQKSNKFYLYHDYQKIAEGIIL